jgi:hypothetical protein
MSLHARNTALTAGIAIGAALTLAACSSGPQHSTRTTSSASGSAHSGGGPAPTTRPVTSSVTTEASAAGPLSGIWSGRYHNQAPTAISGTFTVTFRQSGSQLIGNLVLRTGPTNGGVPVTGTLQGGAIRFGTVGGTPGATIDYTGSVSGNSMSGSYEAPGSPIRGTWTATKSS